MKVLIACEESQAVCKAFRERGHEAYSCDIIECSGGHPEWHIQGDVLRILNPHQISEAFYGIVFRTADGEAHRIKGKWDMIIAHPPCTYLSNAGACRLYPQKGELNFERYNKGLEAKKFFLEFLNANCEKIAVENPIQSKVFEMPPYTQIIQPYEHGHPFTKKKRACGLRTYRSLNPQICANLKDLMFAETQKSGKSKPKKGLYTEKKKALSIVRKPFRALPRLWQNSGGDEMKREVMFSSQSDLWETPQALFDKYNDIYHFETDVCAIPENAKCERFFSPEDDGLSQEWCESHKGYFTKGEAE